MTIDVETINLIIREVRDEMLKYPPDSKEALALWKLKERLEQLA